jgi:hypothetical protein
MRTAVRALVVLVAFFSTTIVASAREWRHRQSPIGGFIEMGLISTTLDAERAHEQGMGSWGGGLELGGGLHVGQMLLAGVQVGGQFTRDRDPFWNDTTGGEMKSSVMFLDASAFVGVQTPGLKIAPHRLLRVGVNYGITTASATRSIDNCIDCDTESMHFKGGTYIEPSISVGGTERGSGMVVVSARIYNRNTGFHERKSDLKYAVIVAYRRMF